MAGLGAVGRPALLHLQNMVSEGGLDRTDELSDWRHEDRRIERRRHVVLREYAQVSAKSGRRGVLRVTQGYVGEVGSVGDLLENRDRALLRSHRIPGGRCLVDHGDLHRRSRRNLVLFLVRLIVRGDIVARDRKLIVLVPGRRIHGDIANLDLLVLISVLPPEIGVRDVDSGRNLPLQFAPGDHVTVIRLENQELLGRGGQQEGLVAGIVQHARVVLELRT